MGRPVVCPHCRRPVNLVGSGPHNPLCDGPGSPADPGAPHYVVGTLAGGERLVLLEAASREAAERRLEALAPTWRAT